MLTIIQRQVGDDWEDCAVQVGPGVQKSRWGAQESKSGLMLPLKSLISCTPVSLETQAEELKSGNLGENHAPHLRITGLKLQLELNYQNPHVHRRITEHPGVICFVRVVAVTQWTAHDFTDYTQLPGSTNETSYRYRYAYGVVVVAQGKGRFGKFDPFSLLTAVCNAIVMVAIPAEIIYWISLYCAGLLSKIYCKAALEYLHVYKDFPGISVRMITAVSAFRALTKQLETPCGSLGPMTVEDVRSCMTDILHRDIQSKVLDNHEIEALVACTLDSLDHDKLGNVLMDDFLHAAAGKETMNMGDIAQFFDVDRRKGWLEMMFDATPQELKRRHQRVSENRLDQKDKAPRVMYEV